MHLLLFLAALIAAVLGIVMLAFGGTHWLAPVAANPLIVAAVTWLLGAVILAALAILAARLRRLADALEVQRMPRTVSPPPPPSFPRPNTVIPALPASTSAVEVQDEKRASLPDPANAVAVPNVPSVPQEIQATPPGPLVAEPDAGTALPARPAAWPRIDPSDRIAPPSGHSAPEVSLTAEDGPLAPAVDGAEGRPPEPAVEVPPHVLKSGVVEGMAYTLYSDGSVEAELPDGIVRFKTIAEWRAHMQAQA